MGLFDLIFGCWHKRCSFPITRARQTAAPHCSVCNRDIRRLPRLRPRVPVRLVADEDPRVQNPHCGGGRARQHRFRYQGGLISDWPGLGHSRRPNDLRFRSGKQSAVSGR